MRGKGSGKKRGVREKKPVKKVVLQTRGQGLLTRADGAKSASKSEEKSSWLVGGRKDGRR